MRRPVRREVVHNDAYDVHVLGAPRPGLRDLYHALLRIPWWGTTAVIVGGYLFLNAVFALLYLAVGGVGNARPGSFADAFFFSVQTMGTIGYGAMAPTTTAANVIVVAESVVGLLATALATGLVFVRFSLTRARVVFSRRIAIGPIDRVPTLMIRIGNERRSLIFDAVFRMTLTRTTHTAEGVLWYRTVDLPLVRDRATTLARSWTALHRIEPGSPLHGETPESLAASDAEIWIAVSGTDDTSLQPVHASRVWPHESIVWGARLADIISEPDPTTMVLDIAGFHELTPTDPTAGFPYSASKEKGQ